MHETGHIAIHAENILPIIKKWLYSEKDIFLRELVANASDAITKLQKLSLVGEVNVEIPEAKIAIEIDKDKKTIVITDTGLGMTADEIKRYINQVAFSGVEDFVAKYKDKEDSQQIIGHFGLGFYSSFMVAKRVEIDTLSYKPDAAAAHWSCDGSTDFTLAPSKRQEIGTTITLHVADDSLDMLESAAIAQILNKYCAFIRYPISLGGQVINDTNPLWVKNPSQLTDKDYTDFYEKLFPFSPKPLFWVHLNLDYPFACKGVLYFPKQESNLELTKGEVKLYCNQVFVDDNVKEMIPEFLTLLRGVIDVPDLPLNVSRSYLQSDPKVQRIAQHITKKVADKLSAMAKTDRPAYESYWEDLQPFVKFGMMRDDKFSEKILPHVIYKTSDGSYKTLDELQTVTKEKLDQDTILYSSDKDAQVAYLKLLTDQGVPVAISHPLMDTHFIPFLEMQSQKKYKFQRVDSDLSGVLVDKGGSSLLVDPTDNQTGRDKLQAIFEKILAPEGKLKIRVEPLKSGQLPAMLLVDENSRRLRDLSRTGAFASMAAFGDVNPEQTLLVNERNPAVAKVLQLSRSFHRDEDLSLLVLQIYDLALLQQGSLPAERMQQFLERTTTVMTRFSAGNPGIVTEL